MHASSSTDEIKEGVIFAVQLEVPDVDLARVFVAVLFQLVRVDHIEHGDGWHCTL